MVVSLVGVKSNTGHESKGLVEVLESKGALDGITVLDQGPILKIGHGLGALGVSQLLNHFVQSF